MLFVELASTSCFLMHLSALPVYCWIYQYFLSFFEFSSTYFLYLSTTSWRRIGEWRYSFTHSSTSALEGGECSASRPGRFNSRERTPGTHWIGGWVGPRVVLDAVVHSNSLIRTVYNEMTDTNDMLPSAGVFVCFLWGELPLYTQEHCSDATEHILPRFI
jgi:hypothetical protein